MPPKWAEVLLRIFLRSRDRDTVAGDLLEEYRETVLPARGCRRAQWWYLRQVLSLIDGVTFGVILGIVFGVWNLIGTAIDPLADDTPAALLLFYGPMFLAWGVAGFTSTRRTGRIRDSVKVGATVAFVTFGVFWIANLVRVNAFLDVVRQREDWQRLVTVYPSSGFNSFRTFVNYDYLRGAPLVLLVPSVIGAITGSIGGLFARLASRSRHLSQS